MHKLTIEDGYIKFNINRNQPYSVPQAKLAESTSIIYPRSIEQAPTFKDISWLISHIATTKKIEGNLLEDLKNKSMELYPNSTINWHNTELFLKYHSDFTKLFSDKYKSENPESIFARMDERIIIRNEIVAVLKNKFNL